MGCDCNKSYNLSMGCCTPIIIPADNYYTKYQTEQKIEEAVSGLTGSTGCCITPEEVESAITSAMTIVEGEIPVSNTALTNDAGYLTEHQQLKTINGNSLVGTGDIEIGTGGTIDLSNYYTTAQTESAISTAVNPKADTTYVQNNYLNKNQIQCVSETEWSQISGSTQPDTLYLIY